MQSTTMAASMIVSPTCNNPRFASSSSSTHFPFLSSSSPSLCNYTPGVCRATQIVDFVPSVSPKVVVREARLDDCWEVVETHCSSFFPEFSFPFDFVLRIDRLMAMIYGFSVPSGCKRSVLVAVISSSMNTLGFQNEDLNFGGFDPKVPMNKGHVAGILTVDTVADYLPRKGPLRQRSLQGSNYYYIVVRPLNAFDTCKHAMTFLYDGTGIAYISNVAVGEKYRRKGIAKRLIAKAEALAWSWGCHAVALHCDLNNPGATNLYKTQGFKCIKVPLGANWPQPKTSPDMQFYFMMKLLRPPATP